MRVPSWCGGLSLSCSLRSAFLCWPGVCKWWKSWLGGCRFAWFLYQVISWYHARPWKRILALRGRCFLSKQFIKSRAGILWLAGADHPKYRKWGSLELERQFPKGGDAGQIKIISLPQRDMRLVQPDANNTALSGCPIWASLFSQGHSWSSLYEFT